MGNEHSQIQGIEIEEKAIEVSDFWTQHHANVHLENATKLSIFSSDQFLNEPFWVPHTPLEKFSKNLMIYRHPYILRYISSWQKSCKFHLAVEDVTPLSHIISQKSAMEICLGLYSIIKALNFLHEKAQVSHNNLCLASIFVTKDGVWKLGALEYLCPYKHLTAEYLQKSRSHRYSKAVDTREDKNLEKCNNKDFVDVFAFCTLAVELLKNKSNEDVDGLSEFKDICKKAVQEPNVLNRPTLTSLLEHDFFKHKFITIHSYLNELLLKSDSEKSEFFTHLKDDLRTLDEKAVASQLGALLLSRIVLLNKVARTCLLPAIMIPKKDDNDGLFSEETFRQYIAPPLLNILRVRDAQIRLLLLKYLPHFMRCFSIVELQMQILPELLVGIKDTNNELVEATLRTLADLVPVLGADVVVGGKRAKLFNNGHPNNKNIIKIGSKMAINSLKPESSAPTSINSLEELVESHRNLPERPRPDGEEGETSTDEIEQSADEGGENWEDWDSEEPINNETSNIEAISTNLSSVKLENHVMKSKKIPDITELDIKNQTKIELEQKDIDFFEDMEPVINSNNKFSIEEHKLSSKLTVSNDNAKEEGWGDDW